MQRYSVFSLLRNALSYHEKWQQAWRSPEPKRQYDVVIIGGGGHGLGAAHYLAKDHGITNVAVLEKAGLVRKVAAGRERQVHAEPERIRRVRACLQELEALWRHRLTGLDAVLSEPLE